MPPTHINRLSDIKPSARGSIEEAAEAYLAEIATVRSRAKNGAADDQTPQGLHVRHTLGVFLPFMAERGLSAIRHVTTPDLSAFIAHARGMVKKNGQPCSDTTIHGWAKDVRALFYFAKKRRYITEQPWEDDMMPPLTKKTKKGMSLEEAVTLLTLPYTRDTMGVRDRAILALTLDVGPRLNSVAFLTVGDISACADGLRVVFNDTKSGEDHTVTLGRTATEAVRAWLRIRGTEDPAAPLWMGRRGPLGRSGVIRVLSIYGKRVGVKSNPHRFRHTCAQLHHEQGMDVAELKSLLGHKKLETTLSYMDGLDERAAASHKRHNALDAGARQKAKLGDLPKPMSKRVKKATKRG